MHAPFTRRVYVLFELRYSVGQSIVKLCICHDYVRMQIPPSSVDTFGLRRIALQR